MSYVTSHPQQVTYANSSYSQPQQQQQWPAAATSSHVRTVQIGAGHNVPVQQQATRTFAAGGASTRVEHSSAPVQFLQSNATARDIPLHQSQQVERVMVNPDSYTNHMGSRGTQQIPMDKQEIMMSEHEIVMPGETVVHPQAVQIEEEEVIMQPETRLAPREVIVQPHTVVQPQEVQVKPQVIVAKPKTVIEPEEVFLTPQTVIQPKGMVIRPQEIVVADEEIVVKTGKTTVHDLGTDVYKQDQDRDIGGHRGVTASYNVSITGNAANTKEVHNMGVNTVRNVRYEGFQNYASPTRTIRFDNNMNNGQQRY